MKSAWVTFLFATVLVTADLSSRAQVHSVGAMATWIAAQTNTILAQTVRPIDSLSRDSWRAVADFRGRRPLAMVVLTNDVWQPPVLEVVNSVNVQYGVNQYWDGYCSFGAWLGREYLGPGTLVDVSFRWDQRPKRTEISFRSMNSTVAADWANEMVTALQEQLGTNCIDRAGSKLPRPQIRSLRRES